MRDATGEKVTVAYCFGQVTHEFVYSMFGMKELDWCGAQRLAHKDWLIAVGSTNIATGRNKAVEAFLATDSDWLLFIDTDQQFPPDTLERMLASADPVARPILSALVMARRDGGEIAPACVLFDDQDPPHPVTPRRIPAAQHWNVAAVGAGCVLIHRSVLEAVGAEYKGKDPFPWFAYSPWLRDGGVLDVMGEDYTFCFRALKLGFTSWVDTSIEVGHVKTWTMGTTDFYRQHPEAARDRWEELPAANVVVVPFKDRWSMTRDLCEQLVEQGDCDLILLLNNGSALDETERAVKWAAKHDHVEVHDTRGLGIHEMWNVGAAEACERFPKVNVCFLNNDLRIGDGLVGGLAFALRNNGDDLVAVCPNYDGRPFLTDGEYIRPLQGICANRYDGSGGLSGFAFMVKGELFSNVGFRFPEDAMWWYGDNYLTLFVDKLGGWYGMVHNWTVEHLDGGGQTGDGWVDYGASEQGQRDLAAFQRACAELGVDVEVRAA